HRDHRDDAGADLPLQVVDHAFQLARRDILDLAAGEADVADPAALDGTPRRGGRRPTPRLDEPALQSAPLLHQCLDPGGQVLGCDLEGLRRLLEEAQPFGDVALRRLAGQRLDPAHAGADGALADDDELPDLAGAPDMGAAAKLDRIVPVCAG